MTTLQSLSTAPIWITWRGEPGEEGKAPRKVPYSAVTGGKASSTDQKTWTLRDVAEAYAARMDMPYGGGLGVILSQLDDYVSLGGIDLDTCRDPQTGDIAAWALEVAERFGSYTEISPSGTGLKVYFLYENENLEEFKEDLGGQFGKKWAIQHPSAHPPAIELYLRARYFAVTWQAQPGFTTDLRIIEPADLEWLIRHAGPSFAGATYKNGSTHHDAHKFDFKAQPDTPLWERIWRRAAFDETLWRRLTGDFEGMADHSRSALAFSIGGLLKNEGFSKQEIGEALAGWAYTETWYREQGANLARQLDRIWTRSFERQEAPQPEPAEPVTLEVIDPRTLHGKEIKPRTWVVEDWIPDGHTTILYGDGGTGKSLVALQLQIAAAIGQKWLGLDTTPCRSLGFYSEDDHDELHRRAFDICNSHGVSLRDLSECRWISRVGEDNSLVIIDRDERLFRAPLWDAVLEAAQTFGARFVIIDGAADTYPGNENIRPLVRQFIQMCCTRLARLINGAVLLLAHPSREGMKSGRFDGGSTAWNNSVRSRLTLSRPTQTDADGAQPDNFIRELSRPKANYAASDATIKIRWQAGAFIREDAMTPTVRRIREENVQQVYLRLLKAVLAQGQRVSDGVTSTVYAPKVFSLRSDREGYSRADFERAQRVLFETGRIRMGVITDKKRMKKEAIFPVEE